MSYHNGPKIPTDDLIFLFDAGNNKSFPATGSYNTCYNLADASRTVISIPSGISGQPFAATGYLTVNLGGTSDSIGTGVNQSTNFTAGAPFTLGALIRTPNTLYKSYLGRSQHVQYGFMLGMQDGVHRMVINNSGNGYAISGPAPNNTPYEFICGTHDARVLRLYVNGSQYSTGTAGFDWLPTNLNFLLGYGGQGGWDPYVGYINFAFIYKRALSAGEVRQIYNALKGRHGI